MKKLFDTQQNNLNKEYENLDRLDIVNKIDKVLKEGFSEDLINKFKKFFNKPGKKNIRFY